MFLNFVCWFVNFLVCFTTHKLTLGQNSKLCDKTILTGKEHLLAGPANQQLSTDCQIHHLTQMTILLTSRVNLVSTLYIWRSTTPVSSLELNAFYALQRTWENEESIIKFEINVTFNYFSSMEYPTRNRDLLFLIHKIFSCIYKQKVLSCVQKYSNFLHS